MEQRRDATGVERVESSRFEQLIFTGGTRVLADLVHVFAPEPWIVAHELTHILTKQAGEGIADLPAWLDEGTATYAETGWRSRRGVALQRALDNDAILSVRSIGSNTNTPGDVDLFYGQSADIVTALIDEFGDERFADLFAVFKRGSTVDDALMEVYGFDREGLDTFYRTQRGLEARGDVEDRSTQIEDEQIGPAGTEQSGEDARRPARSPRPRPPDEAADAPADEPAADSDPEAAVDEADAEAAEAALEGRQQRIEAWNTRVRLGPAFGPGDGLPWPEILTGAGGAALLLSLLALFIALGRGAPPAAVAPPPGPADSPPGPADSPPPPPVAHDPTPGGAWAGWRGADDDAPATGRTRPRLILNEQRVRPGGRPYCPGRIRPPRVRRSGGPLGPRLTGPSPPGPGRPGPRPPGPGPPGPGRRGPPGPGPRPRGSRPAGPCLGALGGGGGWGGLIPAIDAGSIGGRGVSSGLLCTSRQNCASPCEVVTPGKPCRSLTSVSGMRVSCSCIATSWQSSIAKTEASILSDSSASADAVAAARAESGCWNEPTTRTCTRAAQLLDQRRQLLGRRRVSPTPSPTPPRSRRSASTGRRPPARRRSAAGG